jgi:hypothetical protein
MPIKQQTARPVRHGLVSLLIVLLLLSSTACSSSLFKVKPPAALKKMPADAAIADVGALSLSAAPLLTDEETQDLFEANLQLAGVLPLRLELKHNCGPAVELKKVKFSLRDEANGDWKYITAKQAMSRVIKANGVFVYNPNSRKTFEKEFRAYEFDQKTPFTCDERQRHGLIFFLTTQKEAVAAPRGLTLSVIGLAEPVSLKLN